ncbi:hemolysin III family protein [Maribacter sp. ACAM166]|uniref:hemolysin III family protein n=1 Tax=Maribacter sp. ACAM166 TaxID=2508996 RepID=UPI003977DF65
MLIAFTYTSVALIILIEGNGWLISFTVWGIVIFGAQLKLFYTGKHEILSPLRYLVIGWRIVFNFQNLINNTTKQAIKLLMLGGFLYGSNYFLCS